MPQLPPERLDELLRDHDCRATPQRSHIYAVLVAVVMGTSEGLVRELETLGELGLLDRVCVFVPPVNDDEIVERTDGVPLFVEELTKMVLESGLLQERAERYELTGPLPPLAIPTTLHDSLMARLDRLAAVKGLAQLGATLGRRPEVVSARNAQAAP